MPHSSVPNHHPRPSYPSPAPSITSSTSTSSTSFTISLPRPHTTSPLKRTRKTLTSAPLLSTPSFDVPIPPFLSLSLSRKKSAKRTNTVRRVVTAMSSSTASAASTSSALSLDGGEIGGVRFGSGTIGRSGNGTNGRSGGGGIASGGSSGTLERVQKDRKDVAAEVKPSYAFPESALKYSEHLVTADDIAFDILIDRLNQGLDATLELQELLAARAEVESTYAKLVSETLRKRAPKSETGPLRITLDRSLSLQNVYASSHLQLGVRIGEEISGPLSVLLAELKRVRKHVLMARERGGKEVEGFYGVMQKCAKDFISKRKEYKWVKENKKIEMGNAAEKQLNRLKAEMDNA
ncbi:hypothetical protein HK097_005732, partial [Rhizophlyctis rosea]